MDIDLLRYLALLCFWVLVAIGVLGCVLPYPGHLFVLGGCVAGSLISGQTPAWYIWVLLVLLGVAGFFVDNLTAMLGARKFGGGRASVLGALAGVIVGAFFFPLGLILGPFFGALLAEFFVAHKQARQAAKAGLGAALGYGAGVVGKLMLAGLMVALYLYALPS